MNLDREVLIRRENRWNKEKRLTFIRFYREFDSKIDFNNIEDCYNSGVLEHIYTINKSITQSFRSKAGRNFELVIRELFDLFNIEYSYQVTLRNNRAVHRGGHKVDFVVPPLNVGDILGERLIISCKTTLRERFMQDLVYPNLLIITLDSKKVPFPIRIVRVDPALKSFTNLIAELKTYSNKN